MRRRENITRERTEEERERGENLVMHSQRERLPLYNKKRIQSGAHWAPSSRELFFFYKSNFLKAEKKEKKTEIFYWRHNKTKIKRYFLKVHSEK